MTTIDPQTSLGKIRLRVGDWADPVILPDSVIESALEDCDDNVPRAAQLCAHYILATLTSSTHRKLASLEVWGREKFENYIKFIQMTILNPAFMSIAPVPYGSGSDEELHPIIEFQQSWNKNYCVTQSQTLAFDAANSPNDGSLYGILGNGSSSGWQLT